ncbi:MAG: hypothetical protein KAS35_03955 [Candidatus Marinimicrobia bacterium]|nr:hypothetical protein [Candidatus Neomarinimicrobiota bacterium]
MKKFIYSIVILILIISCKKEKENIETQINKHTAKDSVTLNDFGEHKSIHQQEWEEHQEELETDTLKASNK